MAKISEHSDDADVKQLALFETPPTNTSVEERHYVNFHPVSGITPTSNVVHFCVPGQSLQYKDLKHCKLYIWAKIRDADGVPPADDSVFQINNLLQSIWSQVEVSIGGKLISSSSNYPYKSYFKTLLYRCKDTAMKNMLCTELFYEDTERNHDSLNDRQSHQGIYDRCKITEDGIEMEGHLAEDIFNVDKYLLNGVDFDLKLYLT